jgi:phospholipid transport system substrate-binding protein
MRAYAWALALGLGTLAAARESAAGPATDQVKTTVDEVVRIIQDPSLQGTSHVEERRARIRAVVLQRFRFDEMARRALGQEWQKLSPAERTRFVSLFTDLLERSYIAQIEGYRPGQRIGYGAESVDGDVAEVRSTITDPRSHEQTAVNYRLLRTGSTWLVYDLVIDGTSLVNNYRIQFARIIQSSSYQELLARMKAKLEEREQEDRHPTGGAP